MKLNRADLNRLKDQETKADLEGEVVNLNQPDNIDADTWALIQDTGRLACERLWEILSSERFMRVRASDQAKLIKLAQDRAYGVAAVRKEAARKLNGFDVTAEELRDLEKRAKLPEYRVVDAEVLEERAKDE